MRPLSGLVLGVKDVSALSAEALEAFAREEFGVDDKFFFVLRPAPCARVARSGCPWSP